MNNLAAIHSHSYSARPRRARRGTGTLDLLVSFTLLITVISVATPLVFRHGRLLRSHRDYRLALDELSNQMERLTVLPLKDLPTALEQLSPSPFLVERLPSARLAGQLQPAESGQRVTLTMTWDETERVRAPVTLSAWVFGSQLDLRKESTEAASK